jgi:hypothetical protein
MKNIITIISIISLQYMSIGQNDSTLIKSANNSNCFVEYSEELKSFVPEQSSKISCREITIKNLPPQTNSVSVFSVDFGMTGSYTFKIDPTIEIYPDKDVYVEDMLTGQVFDLKTSSSYSFKVNRPIPDRFVLHIDNMLARYFVSSN